MLGVDSVMNIRYLIWIWYARHELMDQLTNLRLDCVPRGLHPLKLAKNSSSRLRHTLRYTLPTHLKPAPGRITTFRSSATETQARLSWNDRTSSGNPKECSMSLQHSDSIHLLLESLCTLIIRFIDATQLNWQQTLGQGVHFWRNLRASVDQVLLQS